MKNWFQFLFSITLILFSISTFAVADGSTVRPYSRIVSFGDSLSDLGTYGMFAGPLGGGKFTTNPGKIWIEVIGEKLQLETKPNRQEGFGLPVEEIGGFNYGQGGARVVFPKAQSVADDEKPTLTARPVIEQVGMFLMKHKAFNADDLVLIQGGPNDLFSALSGLQSGKLTPEQAVQSMFQVANDLSAIIANLKNSGAQKIVVVNLPVIEQTPRVLGLSPQAQQLVASLVNAFNSALAQKLSVLNVLLIDLYSFDLNFNLIHANLGFKDISHPGCKVSSLPTGSSLFCSPRTLVEPGADLTYKFADEIHPSTGYSKAVGEFIFAEIIK